MRIFAGSRDCAGNCRRKCDNVGSGQISKVKAIWIECAVGEGSKGDTLREQKETGSEGVLSKDVRPLILGRRRGLSDDAELTVRMVDDTHGLAMGRGDGPTAAREVHLVVRVAAAAVVEG